MTTLHQKHSPYPFTPHHLLGIVFRNDADYMIMWIEDASVEAVPSGATDAAVSELQALTTSLRHAGVRNVAQMIERVAESGYQEVSEVRFNWMSGTLFQESVRLAEMCREAADERAEILARNVGKHPPQGSTDWPRWIDRTITMNSCAKGSRMLAAASVDALVNEILSVRFPEDFKELEGGLPTKKGRKTPRVGFPGRLKRLAALTGFDAQSPWAKSLHGERDKRHGIAHHRAAYIYDFKDPDSVEPSEDTNPEGVEEMIGTVYQAFISIFGAFRLRVPPTHQPEVRS
jgi:hypothetical protein